MSNIAKTPEKAVFFFRLEDLLAWEDPCDRLYFGHEFCQRLLPSREDALRAAAHATSTERTFTLVTPFVTNAGLRRVQQLVDTLTEGRGGESPEVVVNDWGVLHWLHRTHPALPLALGRLLTKQKRGPRILRIMEKLPPAAVDHFRRSNVDAPPVVRFLEKMSVGRVELDNLLQGISRGEGLTASLYYPYAYVSTTRLCLLMGGDSPGKNLRSLGTCKRECRLYDVTLKHEDMPVPLLLRGNTHFFRHERLPEDLEALNISRLVTIPHL